MPTPPPAVVCSGLTFAWPDGTPVFTDFSLAIGPGRTGLIGLNGSGKSTLLRLIAGELRPPRGSVTVEGELGYVPQNLTLDHRRPRGRGARHRSRPAGPERDRSRGTPARRTSRWSAAIGTSRNGPGPRSAGSAWSMCRWTGGSASSPAARRCCSAWPRSSCAAPACCCWTSRPTTSTSARASRLYDAVGSWKGGDGHRQPRPGAAGAGRPDRRAAGRARCAGTAATSPTTRRRSPWSRRPPSAWCARPSPTCGGRSAS